MMATLERTIRKRPLKPKYHGKKMSLEEFLDFKAEDGFKYEWNNGFLEAREKMIKLSEIYIVENLRAAFEQTEFKKRGGAMITETVCPISEEKYRIPDISFFTKDQITEAREGKFPVPPFIIELVSENDKLCYYENKLEEYFLSGVKVVWLIVPMKQKVYVYTGLKEVKICMGDDICSAAPAIPDFQISVNQIFGN
ncbi:MAG: Uma2 family endonuclease [Chloroherpetonaceae bacterium]|nr:Uma2 family endonuclease [Chloroherpetonaceae bacterium]MDW8019600.1 Uma2 family endonuclease [Chloroherpetonaceae bacterium]